MPPRARSPSPPEDDEPPANRPRRHRFDPSFNDEDSDIIIRTSDRWSFALKRVHLQANSQTFADMFEVANEEPRGRGIEHLPVVDITESYYATYLFLRHLVSSKYLIDSEPPSFLFRTSSQLDLYLLDAFFKMCERYDTPSIRSVVLQLHIRQAVEESPLLTFGLAVAHGELKLAKKSLRGFAERRVVAPGCSKWSTQKSRVNVDQRDLCLSDVSPPFLSRFPLSAIKSFSPTFTPE